MPTIASNEGTVIIHPAMDSTSHETMTADQWRWHQQQRIDEQRDSALSVLLDLEVLATYALGRNEVCHLPIQLIN